MLLLGIATIGTAWCGYQASRWNQDQSDIAREGSDLRVEANRQFGLATQTIVYDANLVAQYAKAVSTATPAYRTSTSRPCSAPASCRCSRRWEAADQSGRDAAAAARGS